jgi:hypothetical protein
MTQAFSPARWAFEITHVLNLTLGAEHFPIDVPMVARDYSAQRFRDDPIIAVKGDDLPGFDGALYRAPAGRRGWGIIYNNRITSVGRINFTLAHEFGHYLLHSTRYPKGLRCGEQDMVRWDSEYAQVEQEANTFAANLLMPLDDFRRQVPAPVKIDMDMIDHCCDRYRVSMIACVLRWLSYTDKRAVLVVSRDGFILWARSSDRALKTGVFFRTSAGPIEVPSQSLAAQPDRLDDGRGLLDHDPGIWFREPVREMTVFAERYDFSISLLVLADDAPAFQHDEGDELDTYDRFVPPVRRREW